MLITKGNFIVISFEPKYKNDTIMDLDVVLGLCEDLKLEIYFSIKDLYKKLNKSINLETFDENDIDFITATMCKAAIYQASIFTDENHAFTPILHNVGKFIEDFETVFNICRNCTITINY